MGLWRNLVAARSSEGRGFDRAGSTSVMPTNKEIIVNSNIYAFVKPTNKAELTALLEEAVRMAEDLERMVDDMSAWLAANATPL